MISNFRARLLSVLLPCALILPLGLQAQDYQVFDLDSNGLMGECTAARIAESGHAVGFGTTLFGNGYGCFWDASGTTPLVPLANDTFSLAFDLTETDVVVGRSDEIEYVGHMIKCYPHAAFWIDNQPTALSTMVTSGPANFTLREANRINEKGQILGIGRYDNPTYTRGFLFEDGTVIDLGALGGGQWNTEPLDLNEQGHAVGRSFTAAGYNHAFLWKDGIMTDLHDPMILLGSSSMALAINESGAIAGHAAYIKNFGWSLATVWDHGQIINLGSLGGNESIARDINDHGTVVGSAITGDPACHAFMWKGGKMIDLNDLIPPGTGWTLMGAYSINDSGLIVGEGFYEPWQCYRAFLLRPDQSGGFEIYGAGCTGSLDYTPGLYGQGWPTSNGDISLVVVNGLGGASGLMLLGAGKGTVPFKGCDIQVMPLLPLVMPIQLAGTGGGAGAWLLETKLPSGLSPVMITMQALLADPGGPMGYAVSNPLEMNIY